LTGVRIVVLIVALVLAIAHSLYARIISRALPLGAYFLVATLLFLIGGLAGSLASGRLFRISNVGLMLLSLVDCSLIFYTRTFPTAFFGDRIVLWSTGWMPPGAVQVFVAQIIMIVVSGYALLRARASGM